MMLMDTTAVDDVAFARRVVGRLEDTALDRDLTLEETEELRDALMFLLDLNELPWQGESA